ncbi:MAG: hypothetical protein GX549_09615 [Clostridiales bacterium]|nr:hypothetical protein [Clostridiales bacterium]
MSSRAEKSAGQTGSYYEKRVAPPGVKIRYPRRDTEAPYPHEQKARPL